MSKTVKAMTRAEFKALEDAANAAFIEMLRCDCRNRLSKRGCKHAQATKSAREAWYAAHPLMGLVAPDKR